MIYGAPPYKAHNDTELDHNARARFYFLSLSLFLLLAIYLRLSFPLGRAAPGGGSGEAEDREIAEVSLRGSLAETWQSQRAISSLFLPAPSFSLFLSPLPSSIRSSTSARSRAYPFRPFEHRARLGSSFVYRSIFSPLCPSRGLSFPRTFLVSRVLWARFPFTFFFASLFALLITTHRAVSRDHVVDLDLL